MRLIVTLLGVLLLGSLMACSDSRVPSVKKDSSLAAIARGKIDIEGGLLNITVPEEGIVSEINVKVGDNIKAGDVLAKFNSEQESLALELAIAQINHSQLELDALKIRLKNSEQLAERWQTAAKEGAAQQAQADEAQQNLQQLHAEINSTKSTLEMANIKRKQAQHALSLRTLRAPQDAVVAKVAAQAGISANSSTPSFVLLPAKPVIVRAEINESFIGQIQKGSAASVSFEATPQTAQLEAHVVYIGKMLEAGHWGDEQQQTSRVVECILEFDQPQHYLIGQNVMVKFHAEH